MTNKPYTLEFHVTGAERKRLVNAIAKFLNCQPKYLGAPSFAYQVAHITIDKDGTATFEDSTASQPAEELIDMLVEQGFAATSAPDSSQEEQVPQAAETAVTGETVGLTVGIPLDKVNLDNLTALLDAKGNLIKKALGITAMPIDADEETVSFPWFVDGLTPGDVKAYTHFISALCEMSHSLKRVVAKEKEVDNDKYAFRCFLLRLGFIGAEYKDERKVLLRNLSGSSAFKSGAKTENGEEGMSDEVSE